MRRCAVVLVLAAVFLSLMILLRCASSGIQSGTSGKHTATGGTAAATPSASPAASPAAPDDSGAERPGTAARTDRIDFTTRILPLLQEKCSPCHFPGGRMYERLPFDQETTIRLLGTRLFTRLREPEDQEILGAYLEQARQPSR